MNIFYARHIKGIEPLSEITLNEEESHHCINVMRMGVNSDIHVTDGSGTLYKATIIYDNPKKCIVRLISVTKYEAKRPFNLHIAAAPTKSIERFEWFLEKATEIGIEEITPLLCDHSERITLRTDRLEKILVSAMKQSQNLYLPLLNKPIDFNGFVNQTREGQKFIAYVEDRQETTLKHEYIAGSSCTILIGPEGDFSKAELTNAYKNGYKAVSLGNSRLRTETAAIVATHTINLLNL
jgi:16S rRNA (uracil1498-N3)-methyltransferase